MDNSSKKIISVYVICKNESKFVETWIESVKEADYIVVLDTGSTDNTLELIKDYCKKINYNNLITDVKIFNPWRFDTPRNEALKMCPENTDIYVSIDLDEVFEPGWANILRSRWTNTTRRASYLYSWSHLLDGSDGRVFRYNKIHGKGWHWKYPVHEMLVDDISEDNQYPHDQSINLINEIHLHHYPDRSKPRTNYLPLLELRKKEGKMNNNKKDYYGLIYLAHEYYYRAKYHEAIQELQEVLTDFKANPLDTASCYLFMGDSFKAIEDYSNAKLSYHKAILVDPTYREPYLNLAQVCLDCKEYSQAIFYVKEGLKKSFRHYTWLERDNSWSYQPYDILSLASFYYGKKRDSLAYAVKAASLDKGNTRLENNVKEILSCMKDTDFIKEGD